MIAEHKGLPVRKEVPLSPLPKQNPGPRLPGSLVHQLPLPTWLNLQTPKEMLSNLQLLSSPGKSSNTEEVGTKRGQSLKKPKASQNE